MIPLVLLMVLVPGAQLQDECEGSACNPRLGDLMVGRAAQLSASSTCGVNGPQNYCIIGYLEEEQKCFICDSRLPYNRYSNPDSHQIENVITAFDPERKMKWWQSENGVHKVSIQLNLETLFQFSHLVLTFKSFRPAAMLVERSKDFGQTWKVFRYFAEDCMAHFPWVSTQHADSVDDVVCDSRYSGSDPSTDGEVVLKALDPIFEIENPYAPHIQELITLTNLRINFTRLFTLGDTLLSRKRRNPEEKYYYALYDMVVRGSCFCNGHASQCMPVDSSRGDAFNEPGMVHGRCVCQHNTVGDNCERCQDFHNDALWRPGGENGANICRRCNCHGHSESCHFDITRYEATGGLSGGVCDNCQHNRVGPQCEQCRPYLYQDAQRSLEDPEGCISCDCDPAGSQANGSCDPVSGRCVCKDNVEGERCDRCKYGFFGLRREDPSGCQMCRCNLLGSVQSHHACNQDTGQCTCDRLATGPTCDQCLPGYWGLGNTVYRCAPCDCDIGGARGTMCSTEDGQCHCLPNMVGRRCTDPAPGHFLPTLDYFLYEAEFAHPLEQSGSSSLSPVLNPSVLPKCEQYFREQGYDFKFSNGRLVLVRKTKRQARRRRQGEWRTIPLDPGSALQIVPRQRTADTPITWTGPGFVRVLDGAGLRFTVDNLPTSMDYQLVIRYEPESPDDWFASISIVPLSSGDSGCTSDPTGTRTMTLPGNTRGAVLDAPVCLNTGGRYFVDITFRKQPSSDSKSSSHLLVDSMGLVPRLESIQDFCSQRDLNLFRQFRCVGLTAELGQGGSMPEVCEGLIGSMSARINNGAVPCRCNVQGSLGPSCSKLGGLCECKPNVMGRCCDTCAPLTFGFGLDGCKPCDCDPRGSVSELCDQVRGQCPCRREVGGRSCDRCQPGYWGFPLCRPCECNGLAELCDQQTGACLNCREHSTGANCERCLEGYFGDPVSREPCGPCLCPDTQSSGRFFASLCSKDHESNSPTCICLNGHTGPQCDSCAPGYYGNLTVPGARCEECPCSNNIDPDDRASCNSVTGECLRCLHNTQGPNCQTCKPGHYGDALGQACKECSCDRRGTEVVQCPLGSPCFCDPRTGQCPCRTGAVGVLCNKCDDGYWNIGGASGCQPCNCDPTNSLNNICDKVTGQCRCRLQFGGRQCDECGENHFGNPDLRCISCDCNMEGTERPACNTDTGECLCRLGVTGIFCDECAPGYDSTFPACTPCHSCATLWVENVTDVQHAAQRMRTFIPRHGDQLQPGYSYRWQRMLEMHSKLDWLVNLTGQSVPKVEKVEKLFQKLGKLKDSIDPNLILIDPSSLLNTDIDNVRRDFKNLLNNLKNKLVDEPVVDQEDIEELADEIKKLHKEFMADDKRVRKANKALEDSMDMRQEVKKKLACCSSKGDMDSLEKKVKALTALNLNEKICGAPGHEECSKSKCGGGLCQDFLGKRICGGPTCKGSVPMSFNATETANQVEDDIIDLLSKLRDSENKIGDAKLVALDTKDITAELQDKLNDSKEKFEKEKNETKELIRRVKDYLMDEMVPPEDIEKVARYVLAIQLPGSPDEIRTFIKNIKDLLSNTTTFNEDLAKLKEQAKELLKKATDLKERTKDIDVSSISKDVYDAEKAQDKANDDLEDANRNKDMAKEQIKNITEKLDKIDKNVGSSRPDDMLDEIKALKNKTEMNRDQAKQAKETADAALEDATDAQTELEDVKNLVDLLKERNSNQTLQDEAREQLKNIITEAEKIKKAFEDKLKEIEDLEKRTQDLIQNKEDKARKVAELLQAVEVLRKEIAQRAEDYISCTL
ncbi:laminin subunit beta-4 [Lampris incognitus]|uniref:laminin subunit beta-4 n=1 Tax=Lampris incognitus TaxID=2546036 RepID=UPI0024B525E2|nr:laminin subunit beta-4 [Lampris incognitus]